MVDNIKPEHYRTGEIDLYEAFSQIFPHNEYRVGMQMIAMRYMFRNKIDRVEDINKAIYTLERLREKEIERAVGNVDAKAETDFEKISKAIRGSKKIRVAGVYREKPYIRKIKLLKELQENGYKYLARDESEVLFAYEIKPEKNTGHWGAWHEDSEIIKNDKFPEVQWGDDEPTKIAVLLAYYEYGGESGN